MVIPKPSQADFPSDEVTRALISRLREGDPEGAALLEQHYRDPLIRFCWGYLGSTEEAEDAVQEVCVKVVQAPNVPQAFRPWLYRIARNQCLNMLRGRARRPDGHTLPEASRVNAALTGQLTGLVNEEIRGQLQELVWSLDEEHREVLRLRYVEGLSRTEIAEILQTPESIVKSRLFEGLKKLRAKARHLRAS